MKTLKKIKSKIKSLVLKKKTFLGVFAVSAAGVLFANLRLVFAQDTEWGEKIALIIAWPLSKLIAGLGDILIWAFDIINKLSVYDQFTEVNYVEVGWIAVRDIVNMLFILGLLFIAFVTVLGLEKYNWSKLLGNLLIVAILVNFSKTLCGIVISFFNIIMVTFANSYASLMSENIFMGLGILYLWDPVQSFRTDNDVAGDMIVAQFSALVYVVITTFLLLIIAVTLAFRIVALWLLIIFSPLAFFAYIFKDASSQMGTIFSKWSSEFIGNCLLGPCITFVLYLSLISMNPGGSLSTFDASESLEGGGSYMKFLIGIVIMVAGLSFCKDFSQAGGKALGAGMNKMSGWGKAAVGAGVGYAVGASKWTAKQPFKGAGKVGNFALGGLGQRFYRSEGKSRFLSPKRWKERYERDKASLYATLSGRELEKRNTEKEQSEQMKDTQKAAGNLQTQEQIRDFVSRSAKADDPTNLEAGLRAAAEMGILDGGMVDDLKDTDWWKKMSIGSKNELGNDLEKMNKEAGGRHIPVSPDRFDPNTGNRIPRTGNINEDTRTELSQVVGNAKKSDFHDQSNQAGFGNFGDVSLDDPDYKRANAHAMGEFEGVLNNQNAYTMSDASKQRLVNKLDFRVADKDTREKMLAADPTLISDVYRPPSRDKGELNEDGTVNKAVYEKNALEHYDTLGSVGKDDAIMMNKVRKRLTTEVDGSGRPIDKKVNGVDYNQGKGFEEDFKDKGDYEFYDPSIIPETEPGESGAAPEPEKPESQKLDTVQRQQEEQNAENAGFNLNNYQQSAVNVAVNQTVDTRQNINKAKTAMDSAEDSDQRNEIMSNLLGQFNEAIQAWDEAGLDVERKDTNDMKKRIADAITSGADETEMKKILDEFESNINYYYYIS